MSAEDGNAEIAEWYMNSQRDRRLQYELCTALNITSLHCAADKLIALGADRQQVGWLLKQAEITLHHLLYLKDQHKGKCEP